MFGHSGTARGRCDVINTRITRSEDASEVCDIVEACAAEFNHLNVATAFRKLLLAQLSRAGPSRAKRDGSRVRVESALQTLERLLEVLLVPRGEEPERRVRRVVHLYTNKTRQIVSRIARICEN